MSWRETLGVTSANEAPNTHNAQNAQNAQKSSGSGHCADSADSAYSDSQEADSTLLETLAHVCRGLDITPADVKVSLAVEDIADWRKGTISTATLAAFAHSLAEHRAMEQGQIPSGFTERAHCRRCGPVWLRVAGEVAGCPWCWNRVAGLPIPRPEPVRCADCLHFGRIDHPHLGHCAAGEPEPVAGLWDTDERYCERFLPGPQQVHKNLPRPVKGATKR